MDLNSAPEIRRALGIVTEAELAQAMDVSVATLLTWRAEGRGPSFTKFGKKVFYFIDDVRDYLINKSVDQGAPAVAQSVAMELADVTVGGNTTGL